MPIDAEPSRVPSEPVAARLDGDVVDGNPPSSMLFSRTPGKIQLDRLDDLSAAERRSSTPSDQQDLVDIVMPDAADRLHVIAAGVH